MAEEKSRYCVSVERGGVSCCDVETDGRGGAQAGRGDLTPPRVRGWHGGDAIDNFVKMDLPGMNQLKKPM